jgi:ABC-type transporter Mla subunit MlaD
MEIGVFIVLAAAGAALGGFWLAGVASGARRMGHPP